MGRALLIRVSVANEEVEVVCSTQQYKSGAWPGKESTSGKTTSDVGSSFY
jgi:hypothetical protein